MNTLPFAREYDLPPRWDGDPVEWAEWAPAPHVFICDRSRRKPTFNQCAACKSAQPRAMAIGVIPRTLNRLTAFRCPDCGQDTIIDLDGDDAWVLDFTDYGPEGSTPPQENPHV